MSRRRSGGKGSHKAPGRQPGTRHREPRADDQPPHHPVFDHAPGVDRRHRRAEDGIATPAERARLLELEHALPKLLEKIAGGRAQRYAPYLLVRSEVGDRGKRPINQPNDPGWMSPDIWLYPADPKVAPEIPPQQLDQQSAAEQSGPDGPPITLYAHVWNLGLAEVIAAKVEFHVQNITEGEPKPHPLGVVVTRLAGRLNPERCHKLVKCPEPFFPTDNQQEIVVRVSSLADKFDSLDAWDPGVDRHVARVTIEPF